MNELFGVSMTTIMWVLVGLFAVCIGVIGAIYLSNRTMFRLGIRNLPRRRAQTGLIVVGLMLATLIITAAFTTGDTIDYSVSNTVLNTLGRTDLRLQFRGANDAGDSADNASQIYGGQQVVPALEAAFQNDPDIAGFFPFEFEPVPVLNQNTNLSEPFAYLTGVDPERLGRFGGLQLVDGGQVNLTGLGDNQVLLSKRAADKLNAAKGQTLSIFIKGLPNDVQVAGIVENEYAGGSLGLGGRGNSAGGIVAKLAVVQRLTGREGQINSVSVALRGGERASYLASDAADKRVMSYVTSDEGKQALGLGALTIKSDKLKADGIEAAELFGNVFTTFFLVLGLFSIASGVLLIFMIFVMLASERRTEMGMMRAIGARRINLVQLFASEGMAYNIMSGAVGAALGVLAAFALVVIGSRLVAGDELSFFEAHVTPRSLVVSYCLGVVLTFLTVVVSSFRISRLNIVAAIRGTDDIHGKEGRRRMHWWWVALGVLLTVPLPPLGLYLLLRRGFGLPSAWVWGPMAILAGIASVALAKPADSQFLFTLGMSIVPLGIAAIARYFGAPRRATWTAVGGYLALFWLVPFGLDEKILGEKLTGNIEMFVLSGVMIVTSFTMLIVFNARLLTSLFENPGGNGTYVAPLALAVLAAVAMAAGLALGDRGDGLGQLCYLLAGLLLISAVLSLVAARFPRFAPALKMGIAYPLANRFRTGMTIAMFSLIVFSLTVMSILNANFSALFASDDARGGWDIVADTNRNNPIPDLRAALAEARAANPASFDPNKLGDTGRTTAVTGLADVRQPDRSNRWRQFAVRAADPAFFTNNQAKFDIRAKGYDSDAAIFQAVATNPALAFVDQNAIARGGFGGNANNWKIAGVEPTAKTMDPVQAEFRDPVSGKSATVTIIGVLSAKVPGDVLSGIYTSEATYAGVFGKPDYRRYYFRVTGGTDADVAAKGIKAALVTRGVQAFSIEKQIADDQATGRGFTRIFQAFMGLGLFVGIAALGVIAFRAVVERRQQIGMLRAIGYQRGTIALSFILESSFVAAMGILSGVAGGAILARNLMTSDDFASTSRVGVTFFIPWTEVLVFVAVAYVFALLMTWWPSRGASRVPIAEALRYE